MTAGDKLPNGLYPDTFINMKGWGRGLIWVNGFNLGWYWPKRGPQITHYLPGPVLHEGFNDIIILEMIVIPLDVAGEHVLVLSAPATLSGLGAFCGVLALLWLFRIDSRAFMHHLELNTRDPPIPPSPLTTTTTTNTSTTSLSGALPCWGPVAHIWSDQKYGLINTAC